MDRDVMQILPTRAINVHIQFHEELNATEVVAVDGAIAYSKTLFGVGDDLAARLRDVFAGDLASLPIMNLMLKFYCTPLTLGLIDFIVELLERRIKDGDDYLLDTCIRIDAEAFREKTAKEKLLSFLSLNLGLLRAVITVPFDYRLTDSDPDADDGFLFLIPNTQVPMAKMFKAAVKELLRGGEVVSAFARSSTVTLYFEPRVPLESPVLLWREMFASMISSPVCKFMCFPERILLDEHEIVKLIKTTQQAGCKGFSFIVKPDSLLTTALSSHLRENVEIRRERKENQARFDFRVTLDIGESDEFIYTQYPDDRCVRAVFFVSCKHQMKDYEIGNAVIILDRFDKRRG